ncbi:MAG: type II secretion system F family protein [Sedimentisphaerales bacterium]|nr:type II secretion system F family protein [Sedimentisphaerales bacterium]
MSVFQYHALTRQGRLMKGTLEAADQQQAEQSLKDMNLDIQMLSKDNTARSHSVVGRSELLLFNQQLSAMAQSGIPLEKSIRHIAAEVATAGSRNLLMGIADDLEAGLPAEQVFEKRKGQFPVLYGRIVKAGIRTGRLSEMLVSLNRHLITAIQMRQTIIEAVTYPAVVAFVALIVLSWIIGYMVPTMRPIFADMGSEIPAITGFILSSPEYVKYVWLGLVVLGISIWLLVHIGKSNAAVQRKLEWFYLHIPLVGRMYRFSGLSRLADALALLVNSGCDIPEALELAAETTGRSRLIRDCGIIAGRIRSGESLVEAGQGIEQLPGLFLYSAQLGIQRNELSDNLYSMSDMYQQQAKINCSRLSALLTPTLLVFLGLFIGFIVLSMFMPMVNMIEDLG